MLFLSSVFFSLSGCGSVNLDLFQKTLKTVERSKLVEKVGKAVIFANFPPLALFVQTKCIYKLYI